MFKINQSDAFCASNYFILFFFVGAIVSKAESRNRTLCFLYIIVTARVAFKLPNHFSIIASYRSSLSLLFCLALGVLLNS